MQKGGKSCPSVLRNTGRFLVKEVKSRKIDSKKRHNSKGEKIMEKFSENLKKIMLAGVGAVAVTAEKSKELLDEMVEKGELTVEQGKVLNEELKHNIKTTVREKMNASVKPSSPEDLSQLLDGMTPEQLEALKEQIRIREAGDETVDEDLKEDTKTE